MFAGYEAIYVPDHLLLSTPLHSIVVAEEIENNRLLADWRRAEVTIEHVEG